MAKYDREFLVPYLENLCALHLAEIKLNKYVNSTQNRVNSLLKGHNYAEPSRPIYDPTIDPGAFKVFKISLIIIVVSFLIALASGEGILSFLLVFVCAISIIVFVGSIFVLISGAIGTKDTNNDEDRNYRKAMEMYNAAKVQDRADHQKGLVLLDQLQGPIAERGKVRSLLQEAYNANVIPGQYRNKYAAVYLYDYFRNSRADDLDLVLNTFVLEQIKAKLDIIIQNQSEIILNQCIAAARQEQALDDQRNYHDRMMNKLDQIHAQGEERLQYERMIESNTAAAAYFVAADYIRKI